MHESIYCVRSSIPPLNWVSYIEVRDGINESSTMIGTRLCGEYPPSIPIQASGSELHLKFFASPLDLEKRKYEEELGRQLIIRRKEVSLLGKCEYQEYEQAHLVV